MSIFEFKQHVDRTSHFMLTILYSPACWRISEFRASAIYKELDLPRCQLYPQPENDYQKNEWEIFMSFLRQRAKVNLKFPKQKFLFMFILLSNMVVTQFSSLNMHVLYRLRL